MFSIFNTSSSETSILVDVGNGTITGALVEFNTNNKPKFIYNSKNYFSVSEQVDVVKLELEMIGLLEKTLSQIVKNGVKSQYLTNKSKKITRILISFSSPWYLSKTKNINLSNEKEFVITESFLNDVLHKEVSLYKQELEKEYEGQNFEVIEKSIIHGKINGYSLDNSIGKNTKKFDASIYVSAVHKVFLEKVFEIIHKVTSLTHKNIHLSTFPLVSFAVIRDYFTKETDFLIMDITGELTDITMVKGEIVDRTVSMPSGKNFLIRQVSKNINVSSEIAESTLKMYTNKKLDEQNSTKVREVLSSSEKEWSIYLENALMELSPTLTLPSTLYLTVDSDYYSIFESFLTTAKMDQTNLFRKNLKISRIDISTLATFYENITGFTLDEFIVLISLFYKKNISQ